MSADKSQTAAAAGEKETRRRSMRETVAAYFQRRPLLMLALGFSSGLPFLLTANTLGFWLRDEGTTLKAIGFISWVGLAYSLKFLWAPLIDKMDAPFFGRRLGRRRGWMITAQIIVGCGLAGMALIGPEGGLVTLAVFAVIVAFASSTQDIVVDAWRIESAADKNELGLLSAAYQLGYRAALLTTDALILVAANHMGWSVSYLLMAALMAVGLVATLKAPEPVSRQTLAEAKAGTAQFFTPRGFFDAVAGPFVSFFRTHGWVALLMLAMISLYRLPEFIMGPMYNPYYHDLGLSKDLIGGVRASVGLIASLLGIAAGGLAAVRLGYVRTLIIGAIVQGLAVASFALLSLSGNDPVIFSMVMAFDNFGVSFAGVALVTYMSSLTSFGYTATQYALLSSTYAYLGKFLKGYSGMLVEGLAQTRPLLEAYAIAFIGAGAIGIPALILCLFLARQHRAPGGPQPGRAPHPVS